jgi:hypothetical protein
LFLGNAELRRAFLELHGIDPGYACPINELARQINGTIVVDADFRDHKDVFARTHAGVANTHGRSAQ